MTGFAVKYNHLMQKVVLTILSCIYTHTYADFLYNTFISVPYHMIVVQPFFPTTDPRVVGITYAKNFPNFYSLPEDWYFARWLLLFYAGVAQV